MAQAAAALSQVGTILCTWRQWDKAGCCFGGVTIALGLALALLYSLRAASDAQYVAKCEVAQASLAENRHPPSECEK